MAWLGVNLNDSLKSIQGQLSNFTKEVLTEGYEEVEESSSEVLVSRDKIKELETQLQLQKYELDEASRMRAELEERLHAADLHAAHQAQALRQQLQAKETELSNLKTTWGWDEAAADEDHNDAAHPRLNNRPRPTPSAATADQETSSARVQELEREISELRDSHQHALAALQDSHQHQLQDLRNQLQQQVRGADDDGLGVSPQREGDQQETKASSDWSSEKDALEGQVSSLQQQLEKQKTTLDRMKELEGEVTSLQQQCSELQKEKEQFSSSLEELDAQNQAAIEQMLKKQCEVADQLSAATIAGEEARQQAAQLQVDKKQLQGEVHHYGTELQTIKSQYQLLVQEVEMQKASIQEKDTQIVQFTASENNLMEHLDNNTKGKREAEKKNKELADSLNSLTKELESFKIEQKANTSQVSEEQQQRIVIGEEKVNILTRDNARLVEEINSAYKCIEEIKSQKKKEVNDLQSKNQELEKELLDHKEKNNTVNVEEIEKHLATCHHELPNDIVAAIGKIAELLTESEWQRNTLEHHVTTITQELRDSKVELEESENVKCEFERECEDLRDQLEELQSGPRPQPEGAARGLPTIEEEENEPLGEQESDITDEKQRISTAAVPQAELASTQALQAQVEALTEARQNLEIEVSGLHSDRETMMGQLREAEGRTGNLANLETEVVSLREQKEALEQRLQAVSKEHESNYTNFVEEKNSLLNQKSSLEQKLEQLSTLDFDKTELETNCSEFKAERDEQEQILQATIRVLEGELEGLRDTLRSKYVETDSASTNLQQHEETESILQSELDSVKTQLIYEKDKVDQFTQMLTEIGQMFKIDKCEVGQIILKIQDANSALERDKIANKIKVDELTKKNETVQKEVDNLKNQINMIEAESVSKIANTEREFHDLRKKLEATESANLLLDENVNNLGHEYEEKDSQIFELKNKLQALQKEHEELIAQENSKINEMTKMNRDALNNVSLMVKEKEAIINENEAKIQSLEMRLEESKRESIALGEANSQQSQEESALKEEREKVSAERIALKEELLKLQRENESVTKDLNENKIAIENVELERDTLLKEKSEALAQLTAYQNDREQMITTIGQKHQESLTYHAEIQRLSQVLQQEVQKSGQEQAALNNQISANQTALAEAAQEEQQLKEQLAALKDVQDHLRISQANLEKNVAQKEELKQTIENLKMEITEFRCKKNSIEQERDQLRVANAQFNSQYQEKSKELKEVKEREVRFSTECERLREHLVTVEETYTREALIAEERESTLRSTLSKMEEKLNNHSHFYNSASKAANVQVETLQDQLAELNSQRVETIMKLNLAEEQADQYKHSLNTLQQVLEDFQKSQSRDIAEAVQREKRQLEEEREKSSELMLEISKLKNQIGDAQGGLAAASRLGEQLEKKEKMIMTLKAQVSSHEEVARRARDEVVALKTSSEVKVDKTLLRNLIVGYFATPTDKRNEVLRIISTVLDLSGEERARVGLDTAGTSWLGSIANFLAPPASNLEVTSKVDVLSNVDVLDHTSLSQAFIRFLEDESSPAPKVRLPAVQMAQQTTEKAEKKAQAKAQAINQVNPFISIGELGPGPVDGNRGSRNSSPLLDVVSSVTQTLPTLSPLAVPTSPIDSTTAVTPTSESLPPSSTNKYLSSLLSPDNTAKVDGNGNK